jgi:signal peptidase I
MARSSPPQTKLAPKAKTPAKGANEPTSREGFRDTVEQIVVAFILAFLVRGFSAEAFVIPTGSMAPTLMGRHKEVTCPECGNVYQVNATDDLEAIASNDPEIERERRRRIGNYTEFGTCNNCRTAAQVQELPSFKGDRILVMKFLYSLPFLPGGGGPKRWDVVVFKYPEEPEVNYIKRLVGMPNEELRTYFGDILTRPSDGNQPFKFERRPLEHQQAMQMLVYDDRHRPKHFAPYPEWRRWRFEEAWKETGDGVFRATASQDWAALRYRHLAPEPDQAKAILAGEPSPTPPRPTLITDFYSYNSFERATAAGRSDSSWFQPHWVGDLTLSFHLEDVSPNGQFRIELVRGGASNLCEIDFASGMATLSHEGKTIGAPQQTGIRPNSRHDVTFANVDGRLTLWVDGKTPFGDGVVYDDGTSPHPLPTAADLDPVTLGIKGGAAAVSGLVLKRDIYYTQNPGESDYQLSFDTIQRTSELFNRLADPAQFGSWNDLKPKEYLIRPGHYMMMGDNSPKSKDGRGWRTTDQLDPNNPDYGWDPNRREYWEVPESLLIGKAFYVYWPHGKPFGPSWGIGRDFRFPFRPYFERMKWIR